MKFINLPGIGGSGERHWQSFWESEERVFERIEVQNWQQPNLNEWLQAVDAKVTQAKGKAVLVAHSLSCLLAAEYVSRNPGAVCGTFLVAPPDPASKPFPREEAFEFIGIARSKLDCPSLVIASKDDPYGTVSYAKSRAELWGAKFVRLGSCGHINDLGSWSEGRKLLAEFGSEVAVNERKSG